MPSTTQPPFRREFQITTPLCRNPGAGQADLEIMQRRPFDEVAISPEPGAISALDKRVQDACVEQLPHVGAPPHSDSFGRCNPRTTCCIFIVRPLDRYERRDGKRNYWFVCSCCPDGGDYSGDSFALSASDFSQQASFVWDGVCGSFVYSAGTGHCGDLHRARRLVVTRAQEFTARFCCRAGGLDAFVRLASARRCAVLPKKEEWR